jgi:branched-chain amino acid transport system substrate-binding protein
MRIEPGTYISAAGRLTALGLLLLAGCGGGSHKEVRTPKGTLTVYLSAPRSGVDAPAGDAVTAGARLALSDARGLAGTRPVQLVGLDSAKPPNPSWDPAAVEANARRAAADPTTIAYIGELDQGGSAVSVPVTNDNDFLQVSPEDGLTALTREQPGAVPGTGPARYYPSRRRTFMRLVPNDGTQAEELVQWAHEQGAQRIAVVQDGEVFGRVLAQQVVFAAGRDGLQAMDPLEPQDDPTGFPGFALKVAEQRPDAVVYTGIGGPLTGALLAAIHHALPAAGLYGSSALATASPTPAGLPDVNLLSPILPPSAYGPRARRMLTRLPPSLDPQLGAEALYGYEAMRVVLDAIRAAGADAGDRLAVARAALTPRMRRSVIGDYRVLQSGDITPARFGAYRRSAAGLHYLGERVASR